MAALGKGIGQRTARRARRRVAVAAIVLTATAAVAMNAPPALASQDPLFATQWNLQQIHAPAAWARATGAGPVIASGNTNSSLGPGQENFSNLNALVVGATDARGLVVPYVNHLSTTKWGVLAPGGSGTGDQRDIMSTWRNLSTPNAT